MLRLFEPQENSLLRIPGLLFARERGTNWYPLLMLVWSIWLFITPLYEPQYFKHWLWPTLASYVLFIPLHFIVYYRDRRWVTPCALTIAALGYAVTPFNPGGQSYMIYACAYLAFSMPPRRALLTMCALLAVYVAEWLYLEWAILYMFSAVVVGLATGLMNISFIKRAQANAALKLSHDEVRRLAALAERERIGRDLHDLLGHTLSLVALKSDLAGRLLHQDPDAAHREIAEVSSVARDALAQVRAAVTGIRAAGMSAELASAKLLLECDGVVLRYVVDDRGPDGHLLPVGVENALAMTVREAATNIQRHARAQRAEIAFAYDGDEAVLRIADDGRGGAIVPGNGLGGMRERIEALGGRLRIESAGGQGTRIEARLPLLG